MVSDELWANGGTAHSGQSSPSKRRTAAYFKSSSPDRDCICIENQHAVGTTATGNGLWQRDDLLEKIEGLATGRRLGEDSACGASALA